LGFGLGFGLVKVFRSLGWVVWVFSVVDGFIIVLHFLYIILLLHYFTHHVQFWF
jgi:hypothetical protein